MKSVKLIGFALSLIPSVAVTEIQAANIQLTTEILQERAALALGVDRNMVQISEVDPRVPWRTKFNATTNSKTWRCYVSDAIVSDAICSDGG